MRAKILVATVMVALTAAVTAPAANTPTWFYSGVACQGSNGNVVCVLNTNSLSNYGIGISKHVVMVMDMRTSKVVYKHLQPNAG